MAEQEAMLREEQDFSREAKIQAVKLMELSGEIQGNLFIPLVLFNREETIELLKKARDETEKLREMI